MEKKKRCEIGKWNGTPKCDHEAGIHTLTFVPRCFWDTVRYIRDTTGMTRTLRICDKDYDALLASPESEIVEDVWD